MNGKFFALKASGEPRGLKSTKNTGANASFIYYPFSIAKKNMKHEQKGRKNTSFTPRV